MTIYYHETMTDAWVKIPGRIAGFLVMVPDSYDGSKPYPVMQFTHGRGQGLGGATPKSLQTISTSGTWQVVPDDWKIAVDKYNIIGVLACYGDGEFIQPEGHDYIYNTVRSKYNTVERWMKQGFSWGCGSLRKEYRSSLTRANRIACTVEVSGTVESDGNGATWKNIADANVAVWAPVHKDDNVVTSKPTLNAVAGINSFNPPVKAEYTLYKGSGHGPTNAVLQIKPFQVPATEGEGLINPAENVYEWYLDILKSGPRPLKRGALTTTPTTPTVPTTPEQPTTVTAAFNIAEGDILTTSEFELDASASKGANSFYWQVQKAESPWNGPAFEKGTVGGPTKKISGLTDGKWQAQLTVNDTIKTKLINFTVKIGNNPASKTLASVAPAPVDITWSDKTTEKGTVEFKDSKWILKDATGKII